MLSFVSPFVQKMHKKKSQDLGPYNGEVVSILDNNSTEIKDENAATLGYG